MQISLKYLTFVEEKKCCVNFKYFAWNDGGSNSWYFTLLRALALPT
jgi:hypothetical protein